MLNKTFIAKRMNKNTFEPYYAKVLSSGYDKADFEKDRKLKLLENLFSLKLYQDYIDKNSLLLYNGRKTRNYPLKRKYLRKIIYQYDEDNNLYITFPKFKSVDKNSKDKFKTIESVPRKLNDYFITDKKSLDDEDDYFEKLRENINQELDNNINFKTISNNDEYNDEIKEKEKRLYKLLSTKYYNNTYENNKYNNKSLPKILNKKNKEDNSFLKRISDIDPVLGRNIYENKSRILTKNQKLNLLYLSELEMFNYVDKLNIKREILDKSKNKNMNKNKLMIKDLFHYDKDKWKKINKQKNFNENEAKINEFNEKNRKKLFNLKNSIDKLESEKIKTESDVQQTISNIDDFLQNNASPLTRQYNQEKSIKNSKIRKKV